MSEAAVQHVHDDLEVIKQDIAVIKHILSEEGKLTAYAKKVLAKARATPDEKYVRHEDLKKQILK